MDWLSMLIFWAVIIALAVWLLGKLFPRVTDAPPSQPMMGHNGASGSSLEVLDQRQARREISRGETQAARRDPKE